MVALSMSVSAQEDGDLFKTQIFLTPYSQMGNWQQSTPRISGRVLAMTGYTRYLGVRDGYAQIPRSSWMSTQPSIEGAFVVQLTEQLSIRTKAGIDSSSNETRNNSFSDLGGDMDNLFLAYTADRYALYGGKIDVGYGDAWHLIDGVYSGFTEGVHYRGAVGFGARRTFGSPGAPTHSVAAVLFKRDGGGLGKRLSFDGGLLRAQGSPSFSDRFKSVVLSYDVRGQGSLEGLQAGLDAGRLEAQPGFGKNTSLVSLRVRYQAALRNRWNAAWYSEATYATAFQGLAVSNGHGVSSISLSRDRWQWVLTGALRKVADRHETLARYGLHGGWDWGISGAVTYVTESGFIVQAGLVRQRDQALVVNQGVVRLAYQLEL
ncbi:hypothetical protein [Alcaligenes endophyticus]|uniref:Porin n=1 Tax=Alcaligenes endophyticus TaxID=1929088 RepID=A0ABT8EIV2_9BURK|nr:hypothetical protein [Alcaligenes endophyticus]MCX5592402.1 hypothetical protein [Alcaligenes endophyticus]MDN4121127.1 hypothetical protein [Alcaligenes endophyticus]